MDDKNVVFDDIASAILFLRRAFLRHQLKAPVRLELGANEDMIRLRHSIPRDMISTVIVVGLKDDPVVSMNICGIEIIAPSQKRAVRGPDGKLGYEYE